MRIEHRKNCLICKRPLDKKNKRRQITCKHSCSNVYTRVSQYLRGRISAGTIKVYINSKNKKKIKNAK